LGGILGESAFSPHITNALSLFSAGPWVSFFNLEKGAEHYEAIYRGKKEISLKRKALQMGYELVPILKTV
jgi:hypothetical protein